MKGGVTKSKHIFLYMREKKSFDAPSVVLTFLHSFAYPSGHYFFALPHTCFLIVSAYNFGAQRDGHILFFYTHT